MQETRKTAMSRRNFFRAVGGGASTAAVVVAATLTPEEAQAYNPGEEETRARYQETDHVKTFYRVNGYQTLGK